MRRNFALSILTGLLAILLTGCLELEITDQPATHEISTAMVTEVQVVFSENDDIGDSEDRILMFAVNKPTGWTIDGITYLSPEHGSGSFVYVGDAALSSDEQNNDYNSVGWGTMVDTMHASTEGMHWQMYKSDRDTTSSGSAADPDTFDITINYTLDATAGDFNLSYWTSTSYDRNPDHTAMMSQSVRAYDPANATMVTFTVNDNTWNYVNIKVKGVMSGWGLFPAYDDGVNGGDETADDHIWTGQYPVVEDGTYGWGAIEDDGSEWGKWLISGPNPEFTVTGGVITGTTDYVIPPDSAVSAGSVKFTVTDGTESYLDIEWKGTPSGWALVQMYDDGTNGDEVAGDFVWTCIVENVPAGDHSWGAIENDGTEWGRWLIEGGNPAFTLDEDLLTLHGITDYVIPAPEYEDVTKTVLFNVDMTEWLDEAGNLGMAVFSVARGDQMRVHGNFNDWANCEDCTMTRTPGTNIFSHAIVVTAQPTQEHKFAYYMELSQETLDTLAARYGEVIEWIGWETSPQNAGNRSFIQGEDDGVNIIELPVSSFYDVFPGSVLPQGETMDVTFTVDMTSAINDHGFDPAADTVFIRTEDKWNNITQGYSSGLGTSHYPSIGYAEPNGDGTYSYTTTFNGPQNWYIHYKWGFWDHSTGAEILEAGGGLGGAARIRYLRQDAGDDCNWPAAYWFPVDDTFSPGPAVQEPWDSTSICVTIVSLDDEYSTNLPTAFHLGDNYPNPFNPSTNVDFTIPAASDISFTIYSITGAEVYSHERADLQAGSYQVTWNGKNAYGMQVPSGIYFYELRAGNDFRQTKKMILLK
jgi:hypothetical protein